MAINETVYSGRRFRQCIDNTPGNEKYNTYSYLTMASDLQFNDGTTAEKKLGNFKGVTTNENQAAGYAADVTLVKSVKTYIMNLITNLTNLVNTINNRLGGLRFYEDSTGKYVVGADSVPKKLGSDINALDDVIGNGGFIELGIKNSHENGANFPFQINLTSYQDYRNLTADNFIFEVIDIQFGVHHSGDQTDYYVNGAGCSVNQVYREYNATTGILTINPNISTGTYNDGTYPDRNCNLGAAAVQYFKAKVYLKSN